VLILDRKRTPADRTPVSRGPQPSVLIRGSRILSGLRLVGFWRIIACLNWIGKEFQPPATAPLRAPVLSFIGMIRILSALRFVRFWRIIACLLDRERTPAARTCSTLEWIGRILELCGYKDINGV
jgi:hypothetical protein